MDRSGRVSADLARTEESNVHDRLDTSSMDTSQAEEAAWKRYIQRRSAASDRQTASNNAKLKRRCRQWLRRFLLQHTLGPRESRTVAKMLLSASACAMRMLNMSHRQTQCVLTVSDLCLNGLIHTFYSADGCCVRATSCGAAVA